VLNTVETDEELIENLSFPVYRRVATWMRIPNNQWGGKAGLSKKAGPGDHGARQGLTAEGA